MVKIKKIFGFLAILLFFSNCGYTPIFSKKDINFSIENIEFLGDENVNGKISKALYSYKDKRDQKKKISLVIKSIKNITIASKNPKGEAQTNKISIDTKVRIILDVNNFIEKSFGRSTIYSVIDRKSELQSIENKLIENLSNEIAQQLIFEILENTK